MKENKKVDVTALGLVCRSCGKPVIEMSFLPKDDVDKKKYDCAACYKPRVREDKKLRQRNEHGERETTVFSKGEQHELTFVEENRGGVKRVVSYLSFDGNSVLIYPGSLRFRPMVGINPATLQPISYGCSVKFKSEGGRVRFGLAMPTLPYTLSVKEWVPDEDLRSCLVATLAFAMRPKPGTDELRLIAWHEGRAVFPDSGAAPIQEGRAIQCLLREAGNVAHALPIGEVGAHVGSAALVKFAEAVGERTHEDLKHVVVRTPKPKVGVGRPKVEADVVLVPEYRGIYDLLSDPGRITVSASSTEDEINRAYRHQQKKLHPDLIYATFGGKDKTPVVVRMQAENYFFAVTEARDRALELINRRKTVKGKIAPASVEVAVVSAPVDPPRAEARSVAADLLERNLAGHHKCSVEDVRKAVKPAGCSTLLEFANLPEKVRKFRIREARKVKPEQVDYRATLAAVSSGKSTGN